MQIQSFPEDRRRFFKELNKDDLYRMPYSGLFKHPMLRFPKIDYYAYIPEGCHLMVPVVIVVPPEGSDCCAFLEESGWRRAADERQLIVFTVSPDAPDEALAALFEDAMSREYMANNMSRMCAAGYGSGAAKARRMVMNTPMTFAGLFLCADQGALPEEQGSADDTPVKVTNAPEDPAAIWDSFLSRFGRYSGIGDRQLRPIVSPEEMGAQFCTMYVDGVRREWYQYVPESVQKDPSKKVPLVVSFHGGSGMHHSHMYSTRWMDVADDRGFIVAFPGASLGGFSAKFGWLPHAAWNSDGSPGQLDDEKFIRLMIKKISEDLPVDQGRVYSNGFSMGASFGQRMLLAMPDVFAAAALSSGVLRGDFYGDFTTAGTNEDHQRPIWVIMGENDIGGGTYENNPDAYRYAEYWTRRNETQSADEPLMHHLGPYHTKVYVNSRGVPMVMYSTVDGKPHSATPQDSWLMYDHFFSKFSMDESGCTVYMEKITMD